MQNLSDRALRERIIGAIVIVVFAILVVPVFLDGPSNEPEIVSESVALPGQSEQGRTQQTIVLERDRSEPVPARSEPQVQQMPEPAPRAEKETVTASASTPPANPEPRPAPAAEANDSATGMFAVQLGSFSDKENAERLAAGLREQGYAAFLSQVQTGSGTMQRVRIGPQKDRKSAEAIAAQLAKSGHSGQVVAHP